LLFAAVKKRIKGAMLSARIMATREDFKKLTVDFELKRVAKTNPIFNYFFNN